MWTWQKKLKKAKVVKLADKLMAIVFWDSEEVLLTHYIPKGVNLNSAYYYKVLCELKADICRKQSDLKNEQISFIHDDAYPHSSEFTMAFFDKLGWFIFPYSAYLPDLAPSDFWLSLRLKDFLGGQHFEVDSQVKQAVTKFFCDCPMSFYAIGMEQLVDQYENSDGD